MRTVPVTYVVRVRVRTTRPEESSITVRTRTINHNRSTRIHIVFIIARAFTSEIYILFLLLNQMKITFILISELV